MDISQILNSSAVQPAQGQHRHHRRNISETVSKMESGVNDALKAGQLTQDEASQMTKTLDSITQTLQSDKTGASLSEDERQSIRKTMQDVGKKLFAATHPDSKIQASGNSNTDVKSLFEQLFEAMKKALQGSDTQEADGANHKHSPADRIEKLGAKIDDAVKAGQLTADQATAMKKQLSSISNELKAAQGDGTAALTDDERKKIGKELHDIGKQLRAATGEDTQQASATTDASASDPFAALLKTLQASGSANTSGSSTVDIFMAQIQSSIQYNQQGVQSMTASVTQSFFSVMA